MFSENNNTDLKEFYQICCRILEDKAIAYAIPLNQLEWYFDPVSKGHIRFYKKLYEMKKDINVLSDNYLFLRFVTSVFNSGYHNDMTNNPEKFKELAKSTRHFNLKQFLKEFPNQKSYELEFRKHPNLNQIGHQRLNKKVRSVYEIATYLSTHDLLAQKSHIKIVKPPKIYGMGKALFADAIKESNLSDIAKPDTHIIDVLNSAFGKSYNKNNLNMQSYEEIQNIMIAIASSNNISVYRLDKIIWLICAKPGNDFYLHKKINYKLELIDKITYKY